MSVRIPWNKGLTKETDKRICDYALKLKGRSLSKKHRKAISKSHKGKKLSENTKKEIGIAHKGMKRTQKTKSNISRAIYNWHETHPNIFSLQNNPFYGKHHTEKTKQKIGKANLGKNSGRWIGGKSFEPYGIDFNDKLREIIRRRDNYTCQLGEELQSDLNQKLSVHHIDYNKQNNNPDNLISLCVSCHVKTNTDREFWIRCFMGEI